LWDRENGIKDLGSLGGTQLGSVNGLNERGQVVGATTIAGDQQLHAFLWDGEKLIDLTEPPFGGDANGEAGWINEAGEVVGLGPVPAYCPAGSLVGPIQHAFLWRKGKIVDLGTLPGTSNSEGDFINSRSQIVGLSWTCDYAFTAFLWENGSLADLNTLIPPDSPFQIFAASSISDQGDIAAFGSLANGDQHALLLIPCDDDHQNIEGCDYSLVETVTTSRAHSTESVTPAQQKLTQSQLLNGVRAALMSRNRRFGARLLK
jgi:probable HAF family extracellular repeat protein